MKRLLVLLPVLLLACATSAPAPAPLPTSTAAGEPTVRSVRFPASPGLAAILARISETPALAAAREAVAVAEGERVQADLAPNPVLMLRGERIDPEELDRGIQKRSFSVSERIETAGKRDARVAVAGDVIAEARAGTRTALYRTARAAAGAHQAAVASAILLHLRQEAADAAAGLVSVQEAKLRGGRLTEAEVVPLRIRLGELRASVAEEEARHREALRRLEGILAVAPGSIRTVAPPMVDDLLPPADSEFERNPEIERLLATVQTAEARVAHAEALATPDVTVGVGFEDGRREGGHGRRQTLGLTVEAPLPVFDRNQGGVLAAKAGVRRNEQLLADAEARVRSEYEESRAVAAALRTSLRTWREQVIPARERDRDLARAAERGGRSDRLPALEAELGLLNARIRMVGLQLAIAERVLDGWALIGRPLDEWKNRTGGAR